MYSASIPRSILLMYSGGVFFGYSLVYSASILTTLAGQCILHVSLHVFVPGGAGARNTRRIRYSVCSVRIRYSVIIMWYSCRWYSGLEYHKEYKQNTNHFFGVFNTTYSSYSSVFWRGGGGILENRLGYRILQNIRIPLEYRTEYHRIR